MITAENFPLLALFLSGASLFFLSGAHLARHYAPTQPRQARHARR